MMVKIEQASGTITRYVAYSIAVALGFVLAFLTTNGKATSQLFGNKVSLTGTVHADVVHPGGGGGCGDPNPNGTACSGSCGGSDGGCGGTGSGCGGGGTGGE